MNVNLVGGMTYPVSDCPRRCCDCGVLLRGALPFEFVAQRTSPFKLCNRLVLGVTFGDTKSPYLCQRLLSDATQETGLDALA